MKTFELKGKSFDTTPHHEYSYKNKDHNENLFESHKFNPDNYPENSVDLKFKVWLSDLSMIFFRVFVVYNNKNIYLDNIID